MKNFILISLLAFLFAGLVPAQERTVNLYPNGVFDLKTANTLSVGYNGSTSDRLIPTTRDTIDYYIAVKNQSAEPLHFYARFQFDTIAGADTTIAITVQYKKFTSESYSDLIASALTSAIGADTAVTKTTLGVTTEYTATGAQANSTIAGYNSTVPSYLAITDSIGGYSTDTTTVASYVIANAAQTITNGAVTTTKLANTALYYGYLRFRLILQGNDHVGTGIKVERIDLQFYN